VEISNFFTDTLLQFNLIYNTQTIYNICWKDCLKIVRKFY